MHKILAILLLILLGLLMLSPLFSVSIQEAIFGAGTSSSSGCSSKSGNIECKLEDSTGGESLSSTPDDSNQLRIRLAKLDRFQANGSSDELESPSTLRQVLFVHRHGDRTPVTFRPKDNLFRESFWTFHGLGQLTNRGKARLFLLGKMIRKRYNGFLGASVSKNQRITRSSGSLRCIESAQTFLAGFLSLDLPGSPDADDLVWDRNTENQLAHLWQPASVLTVPIKFDGMLAEGAECNALSEEYLNVINTCDDAKRINREYARERALLIESLGFEMSNFEEWSWASSQIEVEKSYFPDKIKSELSGSYDRLEEAGNRALVLDQSTLNSRRLRHGLLISEMVRHMQTVRNSTSLNRIQARKFAHYVGHDLTLVIVLGMLDSWQKFGRRPSYASNLAMELHEDRGEWYVRFIYMSEVPSKPVEVHMERCEENHPLGRCALDRFADLMKPYMIDSWQDWMRECKNDLTKLDPYAPIS